MTVNYQLRPFFLIKKLQDGIDQDYIDIYAGGPHGEHLGRVCGNNLPDAIPPQVSQGSKGIRQGPIG